MFYSLFLLSLPFLAYCADHGTFKNCSRVDFCESLRHRQPADVYKLDTSTIEWDSGTIRATLEDTTGGTNLTVTLSQVGPKTLRLQLSEVNSTRYQLQNVLVEQKDAFRFASVEVYNGQVLATAENVTVLLIPSPFSVAYLLDNTTRVVFDGNRLTMPDDSYAFGVDFPQARQFYGIPSHCDNLTLQNTAQIDPYRLKNSDIAYYELNSPMALYGSIPVLYGHGVNGTAGVFLHNAAQQWVDISDNSAYFMAEAGSLDLFILLGPTPTEVVRQYSSLTGNAHLPPLWSLGYHQSRYSYFTQDDVLDVAANLDKYNFPADSIWLDIDYTDGYKYFTWNPVNFSDPLGLQQGLDSRNKKLVVIIDPHVKVEKGYVLYDNGIAHQLFVKNPDGTDFQGACWPGLSSYLDFLNTNTHQLISTMYSYYNFPNTTPTIAGIWNDMNEPSVFDNSLEMTLPPDSVYDSVYNGHVTHREINNLYGFLNSMATYQGLIHRDNSTRRPFVLTRSHFAGSQRFAAVWTGDNIADWGYLKASFAQCLSISIAGISFCGADVGGFFEIPGEELFQRWYQAGAWLPFFRGHSSVNVPRREPYLYPEEVQTVIRKAIETRYRHIPTWYTLFFEHWRFADPVVRPLFYHYPENWDVSRIDDELLVGRNILVRLVAEEGAQSVDIYFPGEEDVWVAAEGGDVQQGGRLATVPVNIQAIPVYYRAGGIIVTKETIRLNTAEMEKDGYTLTVVLDRDGTARGTIYIDDGITFEYANNLDYSYFNIEATGHNVTFTSIDSDATNAFELVVEGIIFRENGTETSYTENKSGVPLKNVKIISGTTVAL